MKHKFLTFVLVVFISILSSCSDDDKDSPSVTIAGKWQVSTQETFECPTAADNKVLTCGTYGFCAIMEFKADNTFEMTRSSGGDRMASGTYGISDSMLYLSYEYNPYSYMDPSTFSITVSGNTMITVSAPGTNCKTRTTYQKI